MSDMNSRGGSRLDHIDTTLADIRTDLRENRVAGRTQFHWLMGIIILVLLAQAALWQRVGYLEGQFAGFGAQLSEIATMLRSRAGG